MIGIFKSPFDMYLIEALEASKKTHARESMRSAVDHLRRAEPLFASDVSMAVFRCITAIEEAASSLMLLMIDKQYPRSDELKRTHHLYKNAMLPFIRIFHRSLVRISSERKFDIELIILNSSVEPLGLAITTKKSDGSESMTQIYPPLSLLLSACGIEIDNEIDIDKFIKNEGAFSVSGYLKQEANLRNKLLYATPSGIPRITIDHRKFFSAKQQAVRTMLCAYFLIEPFEAQLAVTYALNSYLDLIAIVKN